MFSVVSSTSHTVGKQQKPLTSLREALLLAPCLALEGLVPMACIENNNVMFSLQTKRTIYLMKTPFHLNCKLYNILMPSHVHEVNLSIKIVQE